MTTIHLAFKENKQTLLQNPEEVLQKLSFKILEKRKQIITDLINKKIKFKLKSGYFEQGICENVDKNSVYVRIGNEYKKIPLEYVVIQ
tara:strand:+ start:269 stop:532 length:264 start_codon:yes stop_codon:yes gene_type:complete